MPLITGAARTNTDVSPSVAALLAFLIYAPTLFFVPHEAFILALAALLAYRSPRIHSHEFPLFLFVTLGYVNLMLGTRLLDPGHNLSSLGLVLLPLTVYAAKNMPRQAAVFLLWFTAFEAGTAVLEYALGMHYLFPAQAGETAMSANVVDRSLLYRMRTFGLSANSSHISQKAFLGVLLTAFVPYRRTTKIGFGVLFAATLLVTFNRTAMVATAAFVVAGFARQLFRRRVRPSILALFAILVVGTTVVGGVAGNRIAEQFTRGRDFSEFSEDLSGRRVVWQDAARTFAQRPWLGNHSYKFSLKLDGRDFHAHNSFLHLLATHGAIGVLLLIFIAVQIGRTNAAYVGAILLYSLGQYGIFWNVSYIDLLFYFFLTEPHRDSRQPTLTDGRTPIWKPSTHRTTSP